MSNNEVLKKFETGSEYWDKNEFHFVINDLEIHINTEKNNYGTYDLSIYIYSSLLCKFLDNASTISEKLLNCPPIRHVAGSGEVATFGQVVLEILPSKLLSSFEDIESVYLGGYKLGQPLSPLGYSIVTEDDVIQFLKTCYKMICERNSLVDGYFVNGFMILDLAGFDPFYSYIFSCYKASMNPKECFDSLSKTGLEKCYPDTMLNLIDMKYEDICLLYNELKNCLN